MKYIAVICDIKKSTESIIENGTNILSILRKNLNIINKRYADLIVMDFTTIQGDDFQALLSCASNNHNIFELIEHLTILMLPLKIRIGVGIGELTADSKIINRKFSIGTNGSVWWNARNAVEEVELKYEKKVAVLTDIMIKGFGDEQIGKLANLLLMGLYRLRNRRKSEDNDFILQIIESNWMFSGSRQNELAKKINISEKIISKKLNRLNYYYSAEVMKTISELIDKEIKTNEHE